MKAFVIPTSFTAIDKFSKVMQTMSNSVAAFAAKSEVEVARFERKWRGIGDTAQMVAKKSAIVGFAIAAPLALAANEAIKFEDRMADVSKTTGISGKNLEALGDSILALAQTTRTPIEELQQIAAIGGSMGVAEKELVKFTESVNQFNVALGSDFGGVEEASRAISGLKNLFKETRDIDVAQAITRTGSAINALSAKGINVAEVTEFISRIGQLPDAIKPSIQQTAALAATFSKSGITAEIASRAFGDVLLTGLQNLPAFAKQMKLSTQAATELINKDPSAFATKLAESLQGIDAQTLSATLKNLKLTDAGAIKVVGALSTSTEVLAGFQAIANKEFATATSLMNEYNAKNETTAAKLARVRNNMQAFTIMAGTQLLPVITDLLAQVTPIIKSFSSWVKENKPLTGTILKVAGSLAAVSFAVSGVSTVVAIFSKLALLTTTRIAGLTTVQWGLTIATKAMAAGQAILNALMMASPIGLIIAGIAALIALVAAIIIKWNEWGAALSFLLGPLGFIISLAQSFRRNWDMVKDAFATDGILVGLKAIGKVFIDAILMPVQQLLGLVAKFTGFDWAQSAVKSIEAFRGDLGVNVATDESGKPLEAINPKAREQEAMVERIESSRNYTSSLTIKDETGRATLDNSNPLISMPKLTSTATFAF